MNDASNTEFFDDFNVEISEKKKTKKNIGKKTIIMIGIGVGAFIILLIIIIAIITSSNSNSPDDDKDDDEDYETVGEINCIYSINSKETELFYEGYIKENKFGLYVDGNKIKYMKI